MAKYLGPKCKKCRRLGIKLCSKGERGEGNKCALVKRNYPPGIHGPKGYPRLTDYALHLHEKQKIKVIYAVMERQLRKYFDQAVKKQEDTGLALITLLESRLDNVIYRLGLAKSHLQARQFVSHGLFNVNDRRVDVASFQVKAGDKITIKKEKSLKTGKLAENVKNLEKYEMPSWLSWDIKSNTGKIISLPTGDDLNVGVDMRLVIEFYSK